MKALAAFFRLESIEENALLRSESGTGEVVSQNRVIQLEMMSAERSGSLVLEELNLSVNAGEWVVMCGPSGAGKSSLLRVLAGLDAPARGTMRRFGMDVSSETSLKNRSMDGSPLGQNWSIIYFTPLPKILSGVFATGRFRRGGANWSH